MTRSLVKRLVSAGTACVALAVVSVGALTAAQEAKSEYPKPRYPRYLVKPDMSRLLAGARVAVRQPYGRAPLGQMQSGQRAYVFVDGTQDPKTWEAIKQAWGERGVDAVAVGAWEVLGLRKDVFIDRLKRNLQFGKDGWKEVGVFFPGYVKYFPPAIQKEFGEPFTHFVIQDALPGYLDKHPEIEHLFFAPGGKSDMARALGKHGKKFVGNWIYESPIELLNKMPSFPGDVWNLIDDGIVKPVPHVSEGTFTDPEGTRLRWTLTPEQTRNWSTSTGQSNHLSIYPPSSHATWKEAIIRSGANHTGYFPEMTVRLSEHGRVTSVEAGGKNGDLFRMLVNDPRFQNIKVPHAPEKGYWYLMQDGFATNPKSVRDVDILIRGSQQFNNLSERHRAGVQHFSFSLPASPLDNTPQSREDIEYVKAHGLPIGHTMHMHVYFSTVKWKLADTGEWITISDKGNLTILKDPETRALAGKYGDPDAILRYEWIPDIPGINVPGDHERDYAADPWAYILKRWQEIQGGTYDYYIDDYSVSSPALSSRR